MIDGSSLNAVFDQIDDCRLLKRALLVHKDNFRPAELHDGRLVLGEAAKDLSANKESLFQAEEQSAKDKQAVRGVGCGSTGQRAIGQGVRRVG